LTKNGIFYFKNSFIIAGLGKILASNLTSNEQVRTPFKAKTHSLDAPTYLNLKIDKIASEGGVDLTSL
jgi:hypothetical protein